MLVGAKDILIASAKVRVHLARKKRVFRDIGSSRVLVEGQEEEPCDADYNAQKRDVRRELEDSRVAP